MVQRRIGRTDLVCSPVGFGTWEMGATYGHIDADEATRAVHAAIDHGINLFDTAEVYGPFRSEELLAKALGERRSKVILVDKVGFNYTPDGRIDEEHKMNSRYDYVIERAEGCLRRMHTDAIDLLLIHWRDFQTPLDETVRALERLKTDGKIRWYGVSNFDVEMMQTCAQHGTLAANQVGYHLFDQRMDKAVLPYCRKRQIGFMAYGTLAFGLLTGAFTPETTFGSNDWRSHMPAFGLPLFERPSFLKELQAARRLAELAGRYGRTVAQLAIAWVLRNPAVSVALVGMRDERELKENVAAADWQLTAADLAEIGRILEEQGVPTNIDVPQLLVTP